MELDGLLADPELAADLAVREPPCDRLEDDAFAVAEGRSSGASGVGVSGAVAPQTANCRPESALRRTAGRSTAGAS